MNFFFLSTFGSNKTFLPCKLVKIVTSAEELYGTYRLGQFDVSMQPSGFPFGGIEDLRLVFTTSYYSFGRSFTGGADSA